MVIGVQEGTSGLPQEGTEGRVSLQPATQDHRVHEVPHRLLERGVEPAAHRCAHADVGPPRVAHEEELEGGEHRHEQRAAFGAGEGAQAGAERGGQPHPPFSARVGLLGRARPADRQGQQFRGVAQLLAPEVEQLFCPLTAEVAALPGGEVRVLPGRTYGQGPAGAHRVVGVGQFPHHDVHGPSVEDDVVHQHDEHVTVVRDPQDLDTEEGALGQVERLGGQPGTGGVDDGVPRRSVRPTQIGHRNTQAAEGLHDLHGPAVPLSEPGAQGAVARDDVVDGRRQCADVQRPGQVDAPGQGVERVVLLELVQEPQPLLGHRGFADQWFLGVEPVPSLP